MRRPTLGSIGRRRSADELAEGYARCRELTRAHGTTYYWGTLFLPPAQRRDVYGVYALCRLADDIVDEPDAAGLIDLAVPAGAESGQRLDAFEERFYAEWEHGHDPHPILAAIGDTARRLDLPRDCFERFFGAMRLDLTRTSWSSWAELRDVYMEGSAAVIGEMMLPVLRPRTPGAKEPARALGLAFQLTNFIRDVGEDLDRGRVYLPANELARFGADPWARTVTPAWRDFLAAQIARNRALYREAEPGVAMLPPAAARCVGTALSMYSGILSRIEAADYDVFTGRRRVDPLAKTAVAARVVVTGRSRIAPRETPPAPPPGSLDALPRTPADTSDTIGTTRTTGTTGPQAGGWCVVGASEDLGAGASLRRVVGGVPLALWRDGDARVQAGPVAGRPTMPALDDGTLLWAKVPDIAADSGPAPRVPRRPAACLVGVHTGSALGEPRDVLAARLAEWRRCRAGGRLLVRDANAPTQSPGSPLSPDSSSGGSARRPAVRAVIDVPEPLTAALRIVEGPGAGSVLEVHATPIGRDAAGRPVTVLTDAAFVTSHGLGGVLAQAAPLRPLLRALLASTQSRALATLPTSPTLPGPAAERTQQPEQPAHLAAVPS